MRFMRLRFSLLFILGILILGRFGGNMAPVSAAGVDSFIHVATAANITDNATLIDNPLAQGDINVALIVSPNYNPGGVGGVYNNHPIAVRVSATTIGSDTRWEIFNRDNAPMPDGAAFNVAVFRGGPEILQRATTGLVGPNYLLFDHPQLNSQPNAMAVITMLNIASGSVPVTAPVGIWYESTTGHWGGFYEDASPLQYGWAFNVGAF